MKPINEQLKAIVSGLIAGILFARPIVDDGVTWSEGLGIALAAIVAWQAVYWTPRSLGKKSEPPA